MSTANDPNKDYHRRALMEFSVTADKLLGKSHAVLAKFQAAPHLYNATQIFDLILSLETLRLNYGFELRFALKHAELLDPKSDRNRQAALIHDGNPETEGHT